MFTSRPGRRQRAQQPSHRQRARRTSQELQTQKIRIKETSREIIKLTSLGGLSSEDGVGGVTSVVLGGHTSSGRGSGSLGVSTLLSGSGSSLLGGLTLNLLGVTVEEEVGEDVPARRTGRASGNGASETEDFSAEEVPHKTDRMTRLVVGGDGNVDKLGGSVSVTEGNDTIKLLARWTGKREEIETYGMLT